MSTVYNRNQVIDELFIFCEEIRYIAIYQDNKLVSRQREMKTDSSSAESDRYEELLVNPALLTIARQRANIDCGGLKFMIIGYGHFYQLIREIKGGHISICLDKKVDLTNIPDNIFKFLELENNQLFTL